MFFCCFLTSRCKGRGHVETLKVLHLTSIADVLKALNEDLKVEECQVYTNIFSSLHPYFIVWKSELGLKDLPYCNDYFANSDGFSNPSRFSTKKIRHKLIGIMIQSHLKRQRCTGFQKMVRNQSVVPL